MAITTNPYGTALADGQRQFMEQQKRLALEQQRMAEQAMQEGLCSNTAYAAQQKQITATTAAGRLLNGSQAQAKELAEAERKKEKGRQLKRRNQELLLL